MSFFSLTLCPLFPAYSATWNTSHAASGLFFVFPAPLVDPEVAEGCPPLSEVLPSVLCLSGVLPNWPISAKPRRGPAVALWKYFFYCFINLFWVSQLPSLLFSVFRWILSYLPAISLHSLSINGSQQGLCAVLSHVVCVSEPASTPGNPASGWIRCRFSRP